MWRRRCWRTADSPPWHNNTPFPTPLPSPLYCADRTRSHKWRRCLRMAATPPWQPSRGWRLGEGWSWPWPATRAWRRQARAGGGGLQRGFLGAGSAARPAAGHACCPPPHPHPPPPTHPPPPPLTHCCFTSSLCLVNCRRAAGAARSAAGRAARHGRHAAPASAGGHEAGALGQATPNTQLRHTPVRLQCR